MKKTTNFKIKLTQDMAFQYFFKNDKEVLRDMLEAFVPLPDNTSIKEVSVLDSQSLISPSRSKRVIFDIKAQLSTGERINIEMQKYTPTSAFKKRILFYLSRLYSEKLQKGNNYEKVTPAYSLIFTTHDIFKKDFKDFYSEFLMMRKNKPCIKWSEEFGIILVELNKLKKTSPRELVDLKEKWCYFIRNADEEKKEKLHEIARLDKQMDKAVKRFKEMSESEAFRKQAEAEFLDKAERDTIMWQEYYKEKGLKDGRKLGLKQGREQGLEQGREQERQTMVLNMLKKKTDISFISEVTGLSKEQIEKIKK